MGSGLSSAVLSGYGDMREAIGKVDAAFFVGGGLSGFYLRRILPLYQDFYTSTSYGSIKIYYSLEMSEGLFALILIVVCGWRVCVRSPDRKASQSDQCSFIRFNSRNILLPVVQ